MGGVVVQLSGGGSYFVIHQINGRHFYKFFFFAYKGKLRKTFEKVL